MTASTEVEDILEAIAAQEALRGTVPDEVIDPRSSALGCLTASEEVFAGAGMACERARALVDHAMVLDGLGDPDGADRLRAEARAVFGRLGLPRLVAAIGR